MTDLVLPAAIGLCMFFWRQILLLMSECGTLMSECGTVMADIQICSFLCILICTCDPVLHWLILAGGRSSHATESNQFECKSHVGFWPNLGTQLAHTAIVCWISNPEGG